jgi:hypothetical protein
MSALDDCQAPLEAELRACVEGLVLVFQHSQLPILVESDCFQLVDAVQSNTLDRSPFLYWIHEIRHLVSQNRECVFVKVEDVQVRVSDSLANLARVQSCSMTSLGSGPEDVLRQLELDRSVTLLV